MGRWSKNQTVACTTSTFFSPKPCVIPTGQAAQPDSRPELQASSLKAQKIPLAAAGQHRLTDCLGDLGALASLSLKLHKTHAVTETLKHKEKEFKNKIEAQKNSQLYA